ncbi:hypothetical protein SAMN04488028_1096 [Reichenbachiella agariperforans]|uniref:Uncharacterized protein n=1 Tax=Reichenbachiella agariperforans TaxID=156994 RepID=A0A1M6VDL2_REIAG|nr:hypothetical protein BGP76_19275 [Reichenbachiella sp. MSK19-1]SHK79454.1 hypothetical protein SAMN04488028_1096 [Reichenbachiella agariperforans]
MITGKENNTVYFSKKKLQEGEFASTFERIEQILKKYNINYKLLFLQERSYLNNHLGFGHHYSKLIITD